MAKQGGPSLGSLEWLVENRSKNQRLSLELFKLLKTYEKRIRGNSKFENTAQALVAVVFSLWRAVFLSGSAPVGGSRLDHAEMFLEAVISDNSISYQQDKRALRWTFLYYINNASYRLKALAEIYPDMVPKELVKGQGVASRKSWVNWHSVTELAIKNLEKALKVASPEEEDDDDNL